MSRWIDADEIIEDFKNDLVNSKMEALSGNPHDSILINDVIERIKNAPTIELAIPTIPKPLDGYLVATYLQGYKYEDYVLYCPTCGYCYGNVDSFMKKHSEVKYCFNCGQKILWSKDKDNTCLYWKDKGRKE